MSGADWPTRGAKTILRPGPLSRFVYVIRFWRIYVLWVLYYVSKGPETNFHHGLKTVSPPPPDGYSLENLRTPSDDELSDGAAGGTPRQGLTPTGQAAERSANGSQRAAVDGRVYGRADARPPSPWRSTRGTGAVVVETHPRARSRGYRPWRVGGTCISVGSIRASGSQ